MLKLNLMYRLLTLVLFFILGTSTAFSQVGNTSVPPLGAPRIPRVEKPWTDAQREILAPRERNGQVLGLCSTCAQAPALCNAWLEFTDYLLQDSFLPTRDRELLILRIGYLNGGSYEWADDRGLATSVGISEEEMVQITEGPDASGWSDRDSTLLRAADELHISALVSDSIWSSMTARMISASLWRRYSSTFDCNCCGG